MVRGRVSPCYGQIRAVSRTEEDSQKLAPANPGGKSRILGPAGSGLLGVCCFEASEITVSPRHCWIEASEITVSPLHCWIEELELLD